MIKKEYKKGELTVLWQPDLCIHSGICFRRLPEVFKPRERPWIQMDHAENNKIIETVNACPSGAISIKTSKPIDPMTIEPTSPEGIKVVIITNGPAKITGACEIRMPDGSSVSKPNGVSICRCGASANRPFCDGSHKTNGFNG